MSAKLQKCRRLNARTYLGFQVPVHDSLHVKVFERIENLPSDITGFPLCEMVTLGNAVKQLATSDAEGRARNKSG